MKRRDEESGRREKKQTKKIQRKNNNETGRTDFIPFVFSFSSLSPLCLQVNELTPILQERKPRHRQVTHLLTPSKSEQALKGKSTLDGGSSW